jgi:hypothetical protein
VWIVSASARRQLSSLAEDVSARNRHASLMNEKHAKPQSLARCGVARTGDGTRTRDLRRSIDRNDGDWVQASSTRYNGCDSLAAQFSGAAQAQCSRQLFRMSLFLQVHVHCFGSRPLLRQTPNERRRAHTSPGWTQSTSRPKRFARSAPRREMPPWTSPPTKPDQHRSPRSVSEPFRSLTALRLVCLRPSWRARGCRRRRTRCGRATSPCVEERLSRRRLRRTAALAELRGLAKG